VSIDPKGNMRLGPDARPVTLERLKQELVAALAKNPKVKLAIGGDKDAPWGQVVKVMDAAREAGIKESRAYTREPGKP